MILTMFDMNKPFEQSIYEYGVFHNGRIPDSVFNKACDEYHIYEDEAEMMLYNSEKHEFGRYDSGFTITLKS